MIEKRAFQLVHCLRALAKRDLKSALWYLAPEAKGSVKRRRLTPPVSEKQKKLSFVADTFLEFHFGWEPLVQDIYDAASVLSEPVMDLRVTGRGKDIRELRGSGISPGVWRNEGVQIYEAKAYVTGFIRVTNPNVGLLAQLGLANPLSLAWELVPYSFVVDWFVNVSDYLEQFDESLGYTIDYPFHGIRVKGQSDFRGYVYSGGQYLLSRNVQGVGQYFKRALGVPSVELGLQPGIANISASRAATALSLLVQQLSRHVK